MQKETVMSFSNARQNNYVECDWNVISAQLLNQWSELTKAELEGTNHDRHRIALLIEKKYGVQPDMTENYLQNLERTLPLFN